MVNLLAFSNTPTSLTIRSIAFANCCLGTLRTAFNYNRNKFFSVRNYLPLD